jgi:hypothetical protein
MLYKVCPEAISIRDTRHHEVPQGIRLQNCERLVVACIVGVEDDRLETDL